MTRPLTHDDGQTMPDSLLVILASRAAAHAWLVVEPLTKAGPRPAPEPA